MVCLWPPKPNPNPFSMTKINVTDSIATSHNVHMSCDMADDMAIDVDKEDDVALTWPMMWC